jgi:hypothetical protein
MFTTASWLAHLLRRWVRAGYGPNISLVEDGATVATPLNDGEQGIAIVHTADGREFVFTDCRVVERGRTVLRYSEVVCSHWITDNPDTMVQARLKRTHWHRLVLGLAGGQQVTLEQLGQAVFPLLRFFGSVITK